MLDFLGDFLLWATLALINLACVGFYNIGRIYVHGYPLLLLYASILIYQSTKLEYQQKLEFEYELSTQAISKSAISLPRSFIHLSIFTGILNFGGAILRFKQIYLLEVPSIPWLSILSPDLEGREGLMELFRAELIVAAHDWSSYFLCLTFLLAGILNFATTRQLILRDRWVKTLLEPTPGPAPKPNWYEVGA